MAKVVWIREICIDQCDDKYHGTPIWRDEIFKRACGRLDMPSFMYILEQKGVLEKEKDYTVRPKDWGKLSRDSKLPTHFPIALRTFTDEQMQGDESGVPIIDHEYLPLDLVAEEIRLIVLMPAEDASAPLITHLAHESIYGPAVYQCLSYTWGDAEPSEDLIQSGQLLKITKNLDSALRAIRHPTYQQTLWVDAVCINQMDIIERSRQVARMHQIFGMADLVLIWIGDGDEDSDMAVDFIAELGRLEWTVFEEDDGFSKLKWSERLAKEWAATHRLLQRPYFRRLWIVQELALASVPTVLCGTKAVAWAHIHNASMRLRIHQAEVRLMCEHYDVEFGESTVQAYNLRHNGCPNCNRARKPDQDLKLTHKLSWHRQMRKSGQSPTFLYLCLLNRDAECSNPRDKIYALWNLALEASSLGLQPDYSLSTRAVYISFAKAYIEATRSLDMICTPQSHCLPHSHWSETLNLPSWVPDWCGRSPVNSYLRPEDLPINDLEELTSVDAPIYAATRGTKAVTSFFGDDDAQDSQPTTLVCLGLILDKVAYVSNSYVDDPESWCRLAQQRCHRDGKPLPEEELNRQFWSMLMGDATCSWESDSAGSKIRAVNGSINVNTVLKTAQMYPGRSLQPALSGRKLVVSEKGYMGLAPYWVEVGEELGVLLGCSVPVVLNRHGNHFHLRGDCFVQGWMRGEMLDATGKSDEEMEEFLGTTTAPVVIQ